MQEHFVPTASFVATGSGKSSRARQPPAISCLSCFSWSNRPGPSLLWNRFSPRRTRSARRDEPWPQKAQNAQKLGKAFCAFCGCLLRQRTKLLDCRGVARCLRSKHSSAPVWMGPRAHGRAPLQMKPVSQKAKARWYYPRFVDRHFVPSVPFVATHSGKGRGPTECGSPGGFALPSW